MSSGGHNDHSEFPRGIKTETVVGATKLQIQGPVRVKWIQLSTTVPAFAHSIKNYAETETLFTIRPGLDSPYTLFSFFAANGISISSGGVAWATVCYETAEDA
ncbi:MAG: hypothetical protein ACYSW8_26530 [Planctomycetota bacterium]|jgi:hypothetical protein